MFKLFRIILLILTIGFIILSTFALTGSYTNKPYLTDTYLLNIHLSGLDLKQVINLSNLDKRDWQSTSSGNYYVSQSSSVPTSTSSLEWIDSIPSAVSSLLPSSDGGSSTGGYYTTISAAISDLLDNVNYETLGIADVYSIGFWGYCRGQVSETKTYNSSGSLISNFDNSDVNYTWCSHPTPGFTFDPLDILKDELNNTLNDFQVNSQTSPLTYKLQSELRILIDNLNDDDFNLPGGLKEDLNKLNKLTVAGFALILTSIILGFISFIFQLFGFFCSPNKCCLSFMNLIFEFIIFIIALVGAGIITGVYYYVRNEVNNSIEQFGIKSFLSKNLYAFLWSAVAICILIIFFNLLGHCCGLFGTGRKKYRAVGKEQGEEIAYEHKA